MEVRKSSETYTIVGRNETDIIPAGVGAVIISYNEDGQKSIFYSPRGRIKGNSEEELRDSHAEFSARASELNKQSPTTQEGIEKVIELLRSSSQ